MRKFWIIMIIIVVLLALGGSIGIYIYNLKNTSNKNSVKAKELADELKKTLVEEEQNTVSTSSKNIKISHNSIVVKNTLYKICNHEIRQTEVIPVELVNKEEKDIQQYYKDWEIKKYSPTEVVLYREKDEYCDKHYVLRENNGVIAIYKIDDNNKETLRENTQIQTKYLPEIDLIKLKSGIYAIGEEELNSILEDFE
ncbi:MAG: BofC C-terminal domain-containing protein [Clostridia bacterium]